MKRLEISYKYCNIIIYRKDIMTYNDISEHIENEMINY